MATLAGLAAAAPAPSEVVLDATASYLPQMGLVAVGAITVGAGILIFKRGWGFFKGLSR